MTSSTDVPIRDASTIVLWRERAAGPEVLMGQRGAAAVFMPNKFVFPGGAVDLEDAGRALATDLTPEDAERLARRNAGPDARTLACAAVRELWEETGLTLGGAHPIAEAVPESWAGFYAGGVAPRLDPLRFIFRAVTPPGRPRRFDARFFLTSAEAVLGDPDDFSGACDELSHLHWVPLGQARQLALPFITDIVLSEVEALLAGEERPVPFFDHDAERSHFHML
ncbi:MAG: DNA mismatch repair protein MutT [Pseudomonadota bacterium]